MNSMASSLSAGGLDGNGAAISQLAGLVRREASVMAFSDVFLFLTALFAALCLLTFFISRPQSGTKVDAH